VHPEDVDLLVQKMAEIRSGQDNEEYEIRLRMPDQRIKHVRVFGRLIRRPDDRVECVGAVQDVTQRRRSEEALDKARSDLAHVARATSLSTLTASIAHEVNQPLSGISTNASTCLRMLDATPPNIQGARETARRTLRDAQRASDVIARLRALFGKKEFSLEPVDLNEATREVIALSSSDLQRNRVVLQSDLADDLPVVIGDRVQLQQVILNLVRNAADAMAEVHDRPREVIVRTAHENDRDAVCLSVSDTGIGLDEENIDNVFEAFYTTKSTGMGIGLSISRSIVERLNGRIWAGRNTGPGATFAFSIPRDARGAAVVAPE
jgi:signal transduction histidine kinase